MKIGIIGHTGMVGSELVRRGYEPINFRIIDKEKYELRDNDFDIIVYCAGFTDVDQAQEEPSSALLVNAWGVHHLLNHYRGRLLYISTDHVFSGKKWISSGYTERHNPSPINWYGHTKFTGESLTLSPIIRNKVVRTSKLFDENYLREKISVHPKEYTDVLKRSFLHVQHFVDGLVYVLDNWEKMPIILNVSGKDIMSHYMLFGAVLRHWGWDQSLVLPRKKQLKDATPRPIRAGLNVNLAKKLGVPLYSAFDGVKLL